MTKTKQSRKPKPAPQSASERRHFTLWPDTVEDLGAIAEIVRNPNHSQIVRSAIRLFRDALKSGLASESGELKIEAPRPRRRK